MTTMSVETERMMPSRVRKERILCACSVSNATPIGSRSCTRRFTNGSCLKLRCDWDGYRAKVCEVAVNVKFDLPLGVKALLKCPLSYLIKNVPFLFCFSFLPGLLAR